MNLNFLRRQAIISSQARKKNLPYLCELEYLESTGEQIIEIAFDVLTTQTVRYETSNRYTQFGKRQLEGNANNRFFGIDVNGYYQTKNVSTTVQASTTSFDKIVYEAGYVRKLYVNDVQIEAVDASSPTFINRIYLFGASLSTDFNGYVQKKDHRVYVDDVLVFDGIPVLDYNMKPAMYDRVTKTFFYNEGTGADFKYGLKDNEGNLYTSVLYFESTGEQIINIGTPLSAEDSIMHIACQQYTSQSSRQLEGASVAGRWFGTTEGYYHISSGSKTDVMSSTNNYDTIIFSSVPRDIGLTVNDAKIATLSTSVASAKDVSIFSAFGGSRPAYVKKKYHKIYINNKLKFAGIPVINSNGKPAMFDIVTKKPFYNNGTGTDFIIGE